MTTDMKYEDLKDLKYGDEILLSDPMKQSEVPYVYMSNDHHGGFHFISGYGASFMINEQQTIDGFGVVLIDDKHPGWDQELSDHGKTIGNMLTAIENKDDAGVGKILLKSLDESFEAEFFGTDDAE